VVEVVEEEVGEELLGSAELAAGSTGWGNKRRRLLPVRCSWRKMTAGKSRGPVWLAGAVGRLSVQEGHGDEALLWVRSDSSGRLIDDGQWRQSNGWHGVEQRGPRLNEAGDKVRWETPPSVTSGEVVSGGGGGTPRGAVTLAATGAECSPCGERGPKEQGQRVGLGDRPGRSNGNGPLTCRPCLLNDFQISKLYSNL
jgi:hypothetical protein